MPRRRRCSNNDSLNTSSALDGHLCQPYSIKNLNVAAYARPLVDNWMSHGRHRCLKLSNLSRALSMRQNTTCDKRAPLRCNCRCNQITPPHPIVLQQEQGSTSKQSIYTTAFCTPKVQSASQTCLFRRIDDRGKSTIELGLRWVVQHRPSIPNQTKSFLSKCHCHHSRRIAGIRQSWKEKFKGVNRNENHFPFWYWMRQRRKHEISLDCSCTESGWLKWIYLTQHSTIGSAK